MNLSWFTPVKQIAQNDFILSANTYNSYTVEAEKPHRDQQKILQEIGKKEKEMAKLLSEVSKSI